MRHSVGSAWNRVMVVMTLLTVLVMAGGGVVSLGRIERLVRTM